MPTADERAVELRRFFPDRVVAAILGVDQSEIAELAVDPSDEVEGIESGGDPDPDATGIIHFTGDWQQGTDYTPSGFGLKAALGSDLKLYLAIGATDPDVNPTDVAADGLAGNWLPYAPAAGGGGALVSYGYLGPVGDDLLIDTPITDHGVGGEDLVPPVTIEGPAIVTFYLTTWLKEDSAESGAHIVPMVDDVPLRSGQNPNNWTLGIHTPNGGTMTGNFIGGTDGSLSGGLNGSEPGEYTYAGLGSTVYVLEEGEHVLSIKAGPVADPGNDIRFEEGHTRAAFVVEPLEMLEF